MSEADITALASLANDQPWGNEGRGAFATLELIDAAAGTASRRTLGTGSTQAAPGDHNHSVNPLALVGNLVTLIYNETTARWEFGDGTVPDLTGRVANIMWEGTDAQIPAQGTGDAQFWPADKAAKRATGHAS